MYDRLSQQQLRSASCNMFYIDLPHACERIKFNHDDDNNDDEHPLHNGLSVSVLCTTLSSSSTLVVPVTRRATLGDRSFPVAATRAWKALPDFVTAARDVASFSAALKTYLFSRSF